jgi:hypothetical protein
MGFEAKSWLIIKKKYFWYDISILGGNNKFGFTMHLRMTKENTFVPIKIWIKTLNKIHDMIALTKKPNKFKCLILIMW